LDLFDYPQSMALARILVDGYSLLHHWPELAPGQARHSARARDELIHVLTRYHDVTSEPVTVFFDGAGAPPHVPANASSAPVEVLFSRAGQTADQMIERAAHRFQAYGEVLVVTNDHAERDLVAGMGGMTSNCANFIRLIESALTELQDELRNHNRAERNRFGRPHKNKSQ
jgi:predicted RNA-binding protein with PIN domain